MASYTLAEVAVGMKGKFVSLNARQLGGRGYNSRQPVSVVPLYICETQSSRSHCPVRQGSKSFEIRVEDTRLSAIRRIDIP